MKSTHRPDIFAFSAFDTTRNMDFNGYALVRERGNVLVDPVPMSDHDRQHLAELGGAAWIVVTNSDHNRDAVQLARELGAKIAGPAAERDSFPIACDRWLEAGDPAFPGIEVFALDGSKTPGELALLLEDTLITGDLVRGPRGGRLDRLPDAKLRDRDAAIDSIRSLAERPTIEAVLVGDGWPIFRDGHTHLRNLANR